MFVKVQWILHFFPLIHISIPVPHFNVFHSTMLQFYTGFSHELLILIPNHQSPNSVTFLSANIYIYIVTPMEFLLDTIIKSSKNNQIMSNGAKQLLAHYISLFLFFSFIVLSHIWFCQTLFPKQCRFWISSNWPYDCCITWGIGKIIFIYYFLICPMGYQKKVVESYYNSAYSSTSKSAH